MSNFNNPMIINPRLSGIPSWHKLFPVLLGAEAFLSNLSQPPEHWSLHRKQRWLRDNGSLSHIYLLRSANPSLFALLDSDRVFDFYITNSGDMINLSQIVGFYFCGGQQALRNGFTCAHHLQEIHHIDGNTRNNRPGNLRYVTVAQHKIITRHQRGAFWRIPSHRWADFSDDSTPIWNRQGKLVRNRHRFLANILALTLRYTHQWVHRCKGYLLGITQWVMRVIRHLEAGLDTTYIPNPPFLPHSPEDIHEEARA